MAEVKQGPEKKMAFPPPARGALTGTATRLALVFPLPTSSFFSDQRLGSGPVSDDAPAPLGILEARPWTGHVWFRLGTGLDGRFRADGVDRPDGNATTAAKWSPSGRLWLSLYLFFFLSFLSSTPLFLGNRLYIRGREERSRQGKGMVLGPSPPKLEARSG